MIRNLGITRHFKTSKNCIFVFHILKQNLKFRIEQNEKNANIQIKTGSI